MSASDKYKRKEPHSTRWIAAVHSDESSSCDVPACLCICKMYASVLEPPTSATFAPSKETVTCRCVSTGGSRDLVSQFCRLLTAPGRKSSCALPTLARQGCHFSFRIACCRWAVPAWDRAEPPKHFPIPGAAHSTVCNITPPIARLCNHGAPTCPAHYKCTDSRARITHVFEFGK